MPESALRSPVPRQQPDILSGYLQDCRELVLREIGEIIPDARHGNRLYELMRDYPLRAGKAMRPALCIATCRALGGSVEAVLRSAAAIELYHNAFLVHDDIEDDSDLRRAEPTLHRKHGLPIAVNVGDGMLALSMMALLANTQLIGVGKALRVLDAVSRMARESAEGQMIELDWIASGDWTLTDQSYVRMVYKKTTWYSFITPVRVGVITSGASSDRVNAFGRFASLLGVAFQIQDDVLNLVGTEQYGKEIAGDLWEGKHTLILIHAIRRARESERIEAIRILGKPRPPATGSRAARYKTREDVAFISALIERYDGVGYARAIAERRAGGAARAFDRIARGLVPSAHVDFLRELVEFVVRRNR